MERIITSLTISNLEDKEKRSASMHLWIPAASRMRLPIKWKDRLGDLE